MDQAESLRLLQGKKEGVAEWNKRREDGEAIPDLNAVILRSARLCEANLRGINLQGADLCGANLRDADLRDAELSAADFSGANLQGSDLRGANCSTANLHATDLSVCNLCGVNFRGTDLNAADLSGSDLCQADLREANLCKAQLHEADLSGADLSGANLSHADLREVNLHQAKLEKADLREADLTGVNLEGVNLNGACLETTNRDSSGYDDVELVEDERHMHPVGEASETAKSHDELPELILDPVLEKYRARIEKARKSAWLLHCQWPTENFRFKSHLGGYTPYMPADCEWPECESCGQPLQFVWQIDFADSAGATSFVDHGLFQFFYCWECLPSEDGDPGLETRWFPDYDCQEAQQVAQRNYSESDFPKYDSTYQPRGFCWIPFFSVPSIEANKLPIPSKAMQKVVKDDGSSLRHLYSSTEAFHLDGELYSQVGGYARWIQNDDTPICQVCGKPCEFVAAIGSEDTGMLWGDSGFWYFFACQRTKKCYGLDLPGMISQSY